MPSQQKMTSQRQKAITTAAATTPGIINIISPSPTSETPSSSETSVVDEEGFVMNTPISPTPPPQPTQAADGGGSTQISAAVTNIARPKSSSALSSLSSYESPKEQSQQQQVQQAFAAGCSISSGPPSQGVVKASTGIGGKFLFHHQPQQQEQVQSSMRSPGNKGSTGGILESIKESPQPQQHQDEAYNRQLQSMEERAKASGVETSKQDIMEFPTASERKRKQRPAPLHIPSSYSSSSLSTSGGSVPDFSKITSHINPARLTGSSRGLTIVSPLTPAAHGTAGGIGSMMGGVNLSDFNLTYVNVRTRQNRIVQLPRLVASPLPTSANISSSAFFTSE